MNIKNFSNEQFSQFVENVLATSKSDKFVAGPIKTKKIKRSDNVVQVCTKQQIKDINGDTKFTQKIITTFESVSEETIITTMEMDVDKGIAPFKLDLSKEANKYFEECLKQAEATTLQK